MCGIVGIWRFDGQPVDPDALGRMRDTLVHRGPDDSGLWADGPLQLKAFGPVPEPVNCRDSPIGVLPGSLTPMSVEVMPSAGPPTAVNVPS